MTAFLREAAILRKLAALGQGVVARDGGMIFGGPACSAAGAATTLCPAEKDSHRRKHKWIDATFCAQLPP